MVKSRAINGFFGGGADLGKGWQNKFIAGIGHGGGGGNVHALPLFLPPLNT